MRNVYVITEHGNVWGEKGLKYIQDIVKKDYDDMEPINVCQGLLYNSPELMIEELTKNLDSYVIVSYDHIATIPPVSIPAIIQVLKNHLVDNISTWEILRHSAEENKPEMN